MTLYAWKRSRLGTKRRRQGHLTGRRCHINTKPELLLYSKHRITLETNNCCFTRKRRDITEQTHRMQHPRSPNVAAAVTLEPIGDHKHRWCAVSVQSPRHYQSISFFSMTHDWNDFGAEIIWFQSEPNQQPDFSRPTWRWHSCQRLTLAGVTFRNHDTMPRHGSRWQIACKDHSFVAPHARPQLNNTAFISRQWGDRGMRGGGEV